MSLEHARQDVSDDPGLACFSGDLTRFRTIKFASRSECALAVLAEKFIPGWECRTGETFHIKVGPKEVDFFINSAWVEYHPTTRWDWKSSEAAAAYGEHFRALSSEDKRASWLSIKKEFSYRYYKDRRLLLDLTGHHADPLIVCEDVHDVYHKLIRRLGVGYPPEKDFVRLWDGILLSLS
jgi:hypothetical protein